MNYTEEYFNFNYDYIQLWLSTMNNSEQNLCLLNTFKHKNNWNIFLM